MNIPWSKAAKAAVGGLLLLVLLLTVSRWWGEYKVATEAAKAAALASAVPTSTASGDKKQVKNDSKPAESKTKDGKSADKYVIVLQDRLNFRYEPNNLSKTYGRLSKGQKMVLIKKDNGWYQVEDDKGVRGWVSAAPEYTKLQ